ncbi:hypothetical protein SAMN04487941_3554 [Pontibacter akesuensis]|uniref:Uncharacterized protein n=1 Tax=Pontibacter akesuensis TaxID=388950 RepID=A0A1I7K9E5_9BACT|nr:hypothetical protein SAMN04487941_3554 [Pontibacter akesuensis]
MSLVLLIYNKCYIKFFQIYCTFRSNHSLYRCFIRDVQDFIRTFSLEQE